MIRLIVASLLIFLSVQLFGDEHEVFSHPIDKKNKENLNEVMTKLQSKKIIKSDFKQTKTMKVLQKPLINSGTFIFAESKGICWKTETPFKMSFVITDKKMKQIEDGKTTMDVSMEKQPLIHGMTNVFKSMFNGDIKELKKYFSIYYVKKDEKWIIGLKPKKRKMKKFFQSIILEGDTYIEQVTILEKNTDKTILEFTNHENPKELTDSEKSPFDDLDE